MAVFKSPFKRVQQWNTMARIWYLYDAKWQNPYDSAKVIAKYLDGTNKPIYWVHGDCGDQVVVINAKHIALPNNEWMDRVYFHHTGFPGGASWTLAWELHAKQPTLIVQKAVYRLFAQTIQRHAHMARLHIYPEEVVPPEIHKNITAQIRQLRPVPKRLPEYSKDEVINYPRIYDFPKDYVPFIPGKGNRFG